MRNQKAGEMICLRSNRKLGGWNLKPVWFISVHSFLQCCSSPFSTFPHPQVLPQSLCNSYSPCLECVVSIFLWFSSPLLFKCFKYSFLKKGLPDTNHHKKPTLSQFCSHFICSQHLKLYINLFSETHTKMKIPQEQECCLADLLLYPWSLVTGTS